MNQQHRDHAQWVIDQVSSINPYRRQELNEASEFAIYNTGFLASYLTSLMREDPYIRKRFIKHIAKTQESKQPK